MKELYTENYKTLLKETGEVTNKCKYILCSHIGRLNIVKVPMLSKAIYRLNTITIKISRIFFTDIENNSKIYMELNKTSNSQSNPKEKI